MGDIPPDKLIWMTSDELATKELAQWREQETKHVSLLFILSKLWRKPKL